MSTITVSVIVPIYNVKEYLRECLDSLVSQTLKSFEVILVNDGSTDGSEQIAKAYVEKSDIFHLIERVNGGLSAARNTGLECARGKYVYFLDSDDYLLDTALEELYNKAEADKLDVLKFFAYTLSGTSKNMTWSYDGGYKYKGQYPNVYTGRDLLAQLISNEDTSCPSCCLIFTRREVIEKNHLRFCEGIIHEDNLFHWQLLSLSERVAVMNKPLYCRRFRKGSITQIINWDNIMRSMVVSARESDCFLTNYPELLDGTGKWHLMFFIKQAIFAWINMSPSERKQEDVKKYVKKLKFISKKYEYGGNKNVWLFTINTTLYRWYVGLQMKLRNVHD